MIYCVVPEELGPELFDRLSAYYADDPDVTVIVDRRRRERRRGEDAEAAEGAGGKRFVRDRRRARVAGEFPPLPDDPDD